MRIKGQRAAWVLSAAALACVLLPLLGGCRTAVAGDWRLVEAVPNREVFSLDNVSFHRDGTFAATSTIEGLTTSDRGTYDFDGIKLKLRPQAGGQRTYNATLKLDRLEIFDGKRRVVLQKSAKGR